MDTAGPGELLIILLANGLLFGATRPPKLARSPGEGIREFRNALHEGGHPNNPDAAQQPRADSPPAAA